MTESKRIPVILVGIKQPSDSDFESRLEETKQLIEACDLETVLTVTQGTDEHNSPTYVKSGKLEELIGHIEAQEVSTMITNDELSPSQHRNLEEALGITVVDRTQLILLIFEKRAKSREAKLQVQAATLSYLLPRTALDHGSAGRQQGGGARTKGSGESDLQLRKRATERQLHKVQEELREMEATRATQRLKRQKQELYTVALVGYTNAGKSTLLNAMVKESEHDTTKAVSEKNRLFETLDTASRKIDLFGIPVILTDTVGFVSHLPHSLVKAFRSTLEEVRFADLLLHVVDLSHPEMARQAQVTLETLEEIGCEDKPILTVKNKADLIDHPVGFTVSALNGTNIEQLLRVVRKELDKLNPLTILLIPYEDAEILKAIKNDFSQATIRESEDGFLVSLPYTTELPPHYQRYLKR